MTKVIDNKVDLAWMEIIGDTLEAPEECPKCGRSPILASSHPKGAWVCYCEDCAPSGTSYGWDKTCPLAAIVAWNARVRVTRKYRAEHAQDPPQCAECRGEGSYLLFNHRHLCGACGGSGY